MPIHDDIDDAPRRRLPSMAAAEVHDDLVVASHDLERLQRLLRDAGDTLLAHFHGTVREIERLRHAARTPAPADEPMLQHPSTHVAEVITALQFQDMATQLISHTTQRLRGCADRLARQAPHGPGDGPTVVGSPPLRPSPVTQDAMRAGSIELFQTPTADDITAPERPPENLPCIPSSP